MSNRALAAFAKLHNHFVHQSRVKVLVDHIDSIIEGPARVLDLGSGDGRVGALLASKRPDLQIEGLDTLPRPSAAIPTTGYDGQSIPFPDRAFDFILLIDVLHHARSIEDVVSEARRVASRGLVIKDHTPSNAIDFSMLRMMDWAGNRGYGVDLPYAYLRKAEWDELFARHQLRIEEIRTRLHLYPRPLTWVFDRSLHFIARVAKRTAGKPTPCDSPSL